MQCEIKYKIGDKLYEVGTNKIAEYTIYYYCIDIRNQSVTYFCAAGFNLRDEVAWLPIEINQRFGSCIGNFWYDTRLDAENELNRRNESRRKNN